MQNPAPMYPYARAVCPDCSHSMPGVSLACPHCGRPSRFPNVIHVSREEEVDALTARYQAAIKTAELAGCQARLAAFEGHVDGAEACRAYYATEIARLAASDTNTAATYYQCLTGKLRLSDDNCWDRMRRIADSSFFGNLGPDVHFAALSTENRWLENYGEGAVFLKEEMVSHRASLQERNTATYVDLNDFSIKIPPGTSAGWEDKGRLAVAKHVGNICADPQQDFPTLLLCTSPDRAEDRFIEVHFVGTFTIRSVQRIVVRSEALSPVARRNLLSRASELGFEFIELPSMPEPTVLTPVQPALPC